MTVKVAINGFGRIGRNVLKCIFNDDDCAGFEVVTINDLTDAKTLAHLYKYDSVQGVNPVDVEAGDGELIIAGKAIKILSERNPEELPWKELGVDIVVESTGFFTKREGALKHLQAGAKKVLITAPATDPDVTIVLGVNDKLYDPGNHHIISNASCTTNCLAPIAKVLMDNFGIRSGLMTTVHAYTGDQRVHDFPNKDMRKARAATLSMIPTTTGAAVALGRVLPELEGKLDGMAIRVPTANVSVVDLTVDLEKSPDVEDINAAMKDAAENKLKGILGYSELPLVSIDFNGDTRSSIFDAPFTKVIEGGLVKVLSWYDNEWGYSNRLVELTALVL